VPKPGPVLLASLRASGPTIGIKFIGKDLTFG
jgi:hypothetical protein